MAKKNKELFSRIVITIISFASVFLIVFLSKYSVFHPVFALILSALIILCLKEYSGLFKAKGYSPNFILSAIFSVLYVSGNYLGVVNPFWSFLPRLILLCFLFCLFLDQLMRKKEPLINIAASCFGFLYITIPLAMILKIVLFFPGEGGFEGRWWFLYLLLVTKSSDVGGFLIGRYTGKKKLAPQVSPGKTVEGAVGGFIFSFVLSLVLWYCWGFSGSQMSISLLDALSLGILLPIVGQIGDLAESLLKRDAQVKDSSSLPGMGGFLDMVDSLLFTIPVLYVFLKL